MLSCVGGISRRVFHSKATQKVSHHRLITVPLAPTSISTSISSSSLKQSRGIVTKEGFDVLIIGGGMVGTSLACALGSSSLASGLRVGVVDGSDASSLFPLPQEPQLRVSALNLGSVELLKAVGVWESLQEARTAAFYKMEVWDSAGPGAIHFDNSTSETRIGQPGSELGYMVENRLIQAALYDKLKSLPSIQLFCPASVAAVQPGETPEDWVSVKLKDGEELRARLVVGADGGNSLVREAASIPTLGWSYNQRAVVAVVEHSEPNTTAWQRFLPYGPIALLPMYGKYSNIVWTTTPNRAEKLAAISDVAFLKELRKGFTGRMDAGSMGFNLEKLFPSSLPVPFPSISPPIPEPPSISKVVGQRGSFPLRLTHATEYVRPRIALIGDAAHTIHPLAGQGVNLGFADATMLATSIIEGIETGQDIGSLVVLDKYQKNRGTVNTLMITGLEGLKRIFDSNFFPVTFARNVGLSITNIFSPVKDQLRNLALGSHVDVTKIGNRANH